MLQTRSNVGTEACAPLTNRGTYFTVRTCVGTPPQCFDTVADTGSDNVVVPSCVCDDLRDSGCERDEACFRGTNKSDTFSIPQKPGVVTLTFGSGSIQTAIASDIVQVAGVEVNLTDGLLLILSRAQLQVEGDFQGILGLGLPKRKGVDFEANAAGALLTSKSNPYADGTATAIICLLFPQLCAAAAIPYPAAGTEPADSWKNKLFMDVAGVHRFSICFQDGEKPGALRLKVPEFAKPIPQIGELHWGMSFHGISIGSETREVLFCKPQEMASGMKSPCGAIPDSGTTLLTGPTDQVRLLKEGLCQSWQRCNQSQGGPSAHKFDELLANCSDWLPEAGLTGLPSIFLHIPSAGAGNDSFELTPWAWLTQFTVKNKTSCMSGFGTMDYDTAENGQVWILGTPLFYEYTVGFDLHSRQVSLERGRCNPCVPDAALVSADMDMDSRLMPRWQQGPPRLPRLDRNLPL